MDRDSSFIEQLELKTTFSNQAASSDYIGKLPLFLQSKGYISSAIDSVIITDHNTQIYLFAGERYNNLAVKVREMDKFFLQQAGWPAEGGRDLHSFSNYHTASNALLDYFENNGYPFARVNLDSVIVAGNKINAVLNVEKGFLYKIESIRLFGPAKISRNFIHRYLNIARGSPYSKAKFEKINQRLLELPYLKQSQNWDITMLNTGSLVNLYLEPQKNNQVNVLAGFLPSNQQLGGKLLLTVDAKLQLQNAFGSGENLGIMWQQIQPKSPRLHLNYTQPYIFNSPFGVDFLFDLYKRDSSFININGQIGLLHLLSSNKTGKLFLQSQRTNILAIDTFSIKTFRKLPDVADVSSLNLGIDYNVFNTDYKFNPRRGNELSIFASTGNKIIRKNNTISQLKDTAFNYSHLYDSVKLKTYQLRFNIAGAQYLKTGKQTVLKTGVNAGWYESPSYFRNELFQIGGYKLLRGFDEESIFANRYAVATLEYRYLVAQNSNFFVFTDIGWSNNSIIKQANNYLSAGLGLSLQTKGGMFNLSYAAGKRNDVNFDIKQSKIHFGYVSLF